MESRTLLSSQSSERSRSRSSSSRMSLSVACSTSGSGLPNADSRARCRPWFSSQTKVSNWAYFTRHSMIESRLILSVQTFSKMYRISSTTCAPIPDRRILSTSSIFYTTMTLRQEMKCGLNCGYSDMAGTMTCRNSSVLYLRIGLSMCSSPRMCMAVSRLYLKSPSILSMSSLPMQLNSSWMSWAGKNLSSSAKFSWVIRVLRMLVSSYSFKWLVVLFMIRARASSNYCRFCLVTCSALTRSRNRHLRQLSSGQASWHNPSMRAMKQWCAPSCRARQFPTSTQLFYSRGCSSSRLTSSCTRSIETACWALSSTLRLSSLKILA